ncbi:TPA: PGF-pre-PGF domain-containing protein [Methanosarcina acetivorans]|nr:NosD domain-containing protein [Methanosarcina acetivorans]HIH95646.1 PGF-pre-PGF domain-containing protein [Methanosarcina acetivorans]
MVSFAKNRYFVLFALTCMALLPLVQYVGADIGSNSTWSNDSVQNLDTGEFFGTIQAAIDASSDGATIVVYPGTHVENVDVYRQLTIRSSSGNPLDTVVRASSSGDHVFYVNASNVKISGFTISGANQKSPYAGIYLTRAKSCTVEDNIISGNWYGIYLDNSASNILSNNTVSSNSDTGIYLDNSASNVLSNNKVSSNSGTGICLLSSVNNKLTDNTVFSNYRNGIWLKDNSNTNILSGNLASSNTRAGFLLDNQCIGNSLENNVVDANGGHGVYLSAASNSNNLKNNTISSNTLYGIYLSSSGDNRVTEGNRITSNSRGICLSNSNSNRIFNNYFSNTENTYFEGSNTGNSWSTTKAEQVNVVDGPFVGGNFWARPDGTGLSQVSRDLTGDGFLDVEYNLTGTGANGNVDYLPLARTVIVDPSGEKGYTRIQDAVSASSSGYSVAVYPGTYSENVEISKELAIAAISELPQNTVVTASNPETHIFNVRSNGAVIRGFSITGATGTDSSSGIYLDGVSDCILGNNLVSKNSVGICLSNSEGNTLLNNSMSSNTYNFKDSGTLQNEIDTGNTVEGKPVYYLCEKSDVEIGSSSNAGTVYCINCNNITVKDLVLKDSPRGISFYNTGNSRILNNVVQNNFDGISLEASSGNTLDGNTVGKSANNGIYLSDSDSNMVINNTITENKVSGIYLSDSDSNTVINNTITENEVSGIGFSSSGDNLIYNNYFNNINNVDLGTDNSGNTWSTTATAGVNIIGGPMLGGNYWETPEGTGFSQTCTDVGEDYICRQTYTINNNNIDYLPLSNPAGVPPHVEFSANFTGGLAPLPVRFTASSSSIVWPVQWSWDFGDGTSVESGQNNINGTYTGSVDHIYRSAGEYTVNLTVSNGQTSAYKTSRIFVAEPFVSPLSIEKYVVSLDEDTKEIVIKSGYENVEVVDKTVLIRLEGINLYIFSESGFEEDEDGNLKGKYQYAKLEKTLESSKLGDNLTAGFSFSARLNGQLSALLNPDAGITCGPVPGTPNSSIEQAIQDSLNASSLSLNRVAYSLLIEKNGLEGIDISDVSLVMTGPPDYVDTDGGPEKFIIMSWCDGETERLTTGSNTSDSSFEFTGISSTGLSSEGSFVALLMSLASAPEEESEEEDSSGESSSGGSSSGRSSSGGGGGSVSPEDQDNVEIKELSQKFVISGTHVKFAFPRGVTVVSSIELDARRSFGKVSTFVEMLKGKSTLVTSLPEGKVYKNLNIWVGSGGAVTSDNIGNASIQFKIEKAWIRDNNISLSTITLHRYGEGSWTALPTTQVREDRAFYYFKAKTPGFSPFSITGSEKKLQSPEVVSFNERPKTVIKTVSREEKSAYEVPETAAGIQENENGNPSEKGRNLFIFAIPALIIGLVLAVRPVRNKVTGKVRSIISGERESFGFGMDEGEFSETGDSEVNAQGSTAVSKSDESSEIDRIAEEQKASAKKESYRDFISQLNKPKP